MSADERRRIIVAAADARRTEVSEQLTHLVRLLDERGLPVEVALVGDGERLRYLKRQATVTVADGYRRRWIGGLATLLGLHALAGRYKALRVRMWMRRAVHAQWIVLDPQAASFLRYAEGPPPLLVAGLVAPGATLASIDPIDLETLRGADMWLAATEAQREELAQAVEGPVHFIGDLFEPGARFRLPPPDPTGDPIVLSTPSDAWTSVAHTVEVLAGIRRRRPDLPVVWLTDEGDDAWLARHDLDRLVPAEGAPVGLRIRTGAAPIRPRLLVRTGYAATDPHLAVAAAFEAILTVGFEVSDLPAVGPHSIEPFDVERLVDLVCDLATDDAARNESGALLQEAIRQRLDLHHRLAPLFALVEGSGTPD